VVWASWPYTYPVLPLLFFTAVASVWPTLFCAKLCLTLVEAGNALLVYACTRQRWLALLYWASPVSIWWVSREGQFEPLQNLACLCGLYLLQRGNGLAHTAFALAIQVKLMAVLLLPVFAARAQRGQGLVRATLMFALGLVPTLVACLYYPAIGNVLWMMGIASEVTRTNVYFWDVTDPVLNASSVWGVAAFQATSIALLALMVGLAWRSRDWLGYAAPVAFLALCKVSVPVMPWYTLWLYPLVLPVRSPRARLLLFALVPLLEHSSLLMSVFGHYGYSSEIWYQAMTAFTAVGTRPLS